MKMNKQVMGDTHPSNCLIFVAMSHVHQRLKDFDTSVGLLFQVYELYMAQFGDQSIEVGKALLELAQVHIKKREYNEGISYQQKAYKLFSEIVNSK